MTLQISKIASNLNFLATSAIAEKINARIKNGETIYNFTLGDFDPNQFPIPLELENAIIEAYQAKQTNYAFIGGIEILRQAIADYLETSAGLSYHADEIIVASGSRPLIYILFRTIADPEEKIINIVPSWNNYNFIHLAGAKACTIETKAKNHFLPNAAELKPHLAEATLISFNSPLNPAGTVFKESQLREIIDLIVQENETRQLQKQKPLYVFFDMVYRSLIYGDVINPNPIKLNPAIRDYIVFIDGISKSFAATGVRIGWAAGPREIISKMRTILASLGAWAAKPEQFALTKFLHNSTAIDHYLTDLKAKLLQRLNIFYQGFLQLKTQGYLVDVIEPEGAIYLSIKLNLLGKKTLDGKIIQTVDDIFSFLLDYAHVALIPFYAFGASPNSTWFRLSVGTCSIAEAKQAMQNIECAIKNLG